MLFDDAARFSVKVNFNDAGLAAKSQQAAAIQVDERPYDNVWAAVDAGVAHRTAI